MPYVGSFPQSGCRFTDPTQLLMIEFEFGSTGAEEISEFHKLLLVNGTKPFRLEPCPVDITSHARLPQPVPVLPVAFPEPFEAEPPEVTVAFVELPQPTRATIRKRKLQQVKIFFA